MVDPTPRKVIEMLKPLSDAPWTVPANPCSCSFENVPVGCPVYIPSTTKLKMTVTAPTAA